MTTNISFLGAAETVTGSKYLVETDDARILIDCGLFQGDRAHRERNWSPPPQLDPASLDAVLLTHAHIDHSGYLPRLREDGFAGRVHCTAGTLDLLRILLPDAGYLQEEEARRASKGNDRDHPSRPLYTRADAEACLSSLHAEQFAEPFAPAAGITARYSRAGHILGSGCIHLDVGGMRLLFSGDVGRPVDPIMNPPDPLPEADYLVVESTYGDRRHSEEDVSAALERIIRETVAERGVILVPAFAVGRAQHLLHLLADLQRARRIPEMPVYLDSPMAINATDIFCRHKADHRLTEDQCHAMCGLAEYTRSADESKSIGRQPGPMIVISASGMATGGRILHHLRRFLPDAKNAVLFVGYQVPGTRGRSLVDGADEVRIHGRSIPVRAKIHEIPGLSAHADYGELIEWLRNSPISPQKIFVTHGDPAAAEAFRRRLHDQLGWEATVPADGTTWTLE